MYKLNTIDILTYGVQYNLTIIIIVTLILIYTSIKRYN